MLQSIPSAQTQALSVGALRLGQYANCVILVWSGPFAEAEIEALNGFTAKAVEASPEGIVILALVEAGTPMPSSEGRRVLEQYFARYADRTRAVAHVAEGKGLWASMARSVMTALQLLRKRNAPAKVVSESTEATEWLAPYLIPQQIGGSDARTGLDAYLATLRRADG